MRNPIQRFGIGLVSALLAACGGGGDSTTTPAPAPVPVDQSMVVAGTVTGFDGVVIDGVSYSAANAVVALDIDPRSETAGTMADVKLGQQVEAALDAGGVTKLLVRATAIGPVESISAATNSFKVLGQTIKVVTAAPGMTMFEGVDNLTGLGVGNWVEVHGALDADKNIVATRVEVKLASGTVGVRAGGLIKDFNAAAKTFKLGDLTVNYTNAALLPADAVLANDVFVFVYSDTLPTAGTLAAKAVRVVRLPTLEGRRFTIGGLVTDAAVDGKTFKVNGIRINAANAELKGGQNPTFADIRNMALVRVEGSLGGTPGALVISATRVWIIPASEQRRVMLAGQVTSYVSAASFKVQGVPVNADTAVFRGGVKADLKDGAFVLIKGRIDGALVKADEVEFSTPPRDTPIRLLGVVSDYVPAAGATLASFKLLGIPMQLAANATFVGGTRADFGNGDLVEVRGAFNGVAFIVSEVQFRPTAIVPMIYLEGVISNVSATGFTLNGAPIVVNAQTQIVNGPLVNGQRVEVKARLEGALVVAVEVEVQVPSIMARLMGPISALSTSAKTFVVQGQTVVYGATTQYRGGAEADLANGRMVRVEGSLAAGKVNATGVMFLGR